MKFFDFMMRHAAPVLFWTSILVFLGGIATALLLEQGFNSYQSDSVIDARAFVSAIYQALATASLPFLGAALVWTLQSRAEDRDR